MPKGEVAKRFRLERPFSPLRSGLTFHSVMRLEPARRPAVIERKEGRAP